MSDQELPPPGNYNAVAIERADDQGLTAYARWSLTKKEKKQVSATFKLLDFPSFTPIWYGSFSATVMGNSGKTVAQRTVESLRYMGFKGDDFLELETQKLDQIVSIAIEHEVSDKDGKTYLRVSWVNQIGGGVIKIARPLSDEDKRKFAATMRASLAKVPEVDGERYSPGADTSASNANGGSTTQPANSGPDFGGGEIPPPIEDDIPF